jgi:hypothetical protein
MAHAATFVSHCHMDVIKRHKPTIFIPFLFAVLAILFGIWSFYAIISGNPLWFQIPARSYAPGRITIHYYGTATELEPDSEEFQEMERALNQSLDQFNGRIPLGLSPETLQDYYDKEYVLEVFFPHDIGPIIGLNLPINQLLIPIDGRHSDNRYVFTGNNGEWLAMALIMEDAQPIIVTLSNLGYLIQ